jgi:predicted nucleotidyltransferase
MINISKPQFTLLQQEILTCLIIKAGASFNARGLAKSLNRTQAGIVKALPELEKEKLVKIKKDKGSGRWSIELNIDSQKTINTKRVENLKMIYGSGLSVFLKNSFPGCTIILFGSYSRGEDIYAKETEENSSDIEIAIIGSKEKNLELKKFEKLLEREIILNFYQSFKEIHQHLKNNILNGILLYGSVDL